MARTQQIFKIDKRDVEDTIALSLALGEAEKTEHIRAFCRLFALPLDAVNIKVKQDNYDRVVKAVSGNIPKKK